MCSSVSAWEPAADLSGAMGAAIERLEGDGWQAEVTPEYGFVFIRRETERRLLALTPALSVRHEAAVVFTISTGVTARKY
jgi:hypothetical protein